MPSFASYVMVDWSAASAPRLGRDSIWIAVAQRTRRKRARAGGAARTDLVNLRTRAEAVSWLEARLATLATKGRVLAGFDFPFGYPAGTAARLGLNGTAWRSLWTELATAISDDAANANNRFDLAEDWNRRICGEAFPFWGNVREERRAHLLRRGCRAHGPGDLPRRRLADARVPGAHPVWQLAGNGSVGSQALLGIPRVWQLRHAPALEMIAAIWPFETGLADDAGKRVILAESYPSLVKAKRLAHLPKDAGQVAAMVEAFAEADAAGTLPGWFAGDAELSAAERAAVEAEEAWILGLNGRAKRVLRRRIARRRRKRARRG
jgi:precorrin-8X/cobalt-precorrin-8 methylmutase